MIRKTIGFIFGVYISLILMLFFFQRNIQYVPSGTLKEVSNYNLEGFVEIELVTSDDITLKSWYKSTDKSSKIILYFHGNAGHLGNRASKFGMLSRNYDILAISYRGYGQNEGNPSEEGFIKDSEAAYDFLLKEGYSENNIIIYGESIGSGVAVNLAQNKNVKAVMLESPYSSVLSVAQNNYPFVPVKWLLKDHFRSDLRVVNVTSPILIIHGTKDKVIDISEAQKLYSLVKSKKNFVKVEGAGHVNFDHKFLLDEIDSFIGEI